MKNKKNVIIVSMLVLVAVMAIGYSYFATRLNINATGNITTNWNVYFSNITNGTVVGSASNNKTPSVTATTATMDVNLSLPGDSITYELTLTNGGTIGAIIEDIKAETKGSSAIIYSISGIKIGDKLASGANKKITIKIEYDPNTTSQPAVTNKTLTVIIDAVQDIGQSINSSDIVIEEKTLAARILKENAPQSDSAIDFSKSSKEDGTKGLYYTNVNTENNKTTYYFRGNVENNYVSFASDSEGNEIIWRIVRINEDGSIRLIKETNAGSSPFNDNYVNTDVGFMYGTTGASSYALTHENTNDSIIKDALDTWYTSNLSNYSNYLADAGFCNDRSIAPSANTWNSSDTALGYGRNKTYYGPYNRIENLNQPQFACPQTNDLFTLKGSNKGNKALDNPIGLLTADEVVYAGGKRYESNEDYYLANGVVWWTMSPRYFVGDYAYVWSVDAAGDASHGIADDEGGVRPVINLKSNVEFTLEGTGTPGSSTNPYTIKVN